MFTACVFNLPSRVKAFFSVSTGQVIVIPKIETFVVNIFYRSIFVVVLHCSTFYAEAHVSAQSLACALKDRPSKYV